MWSDLYSCTTEAVPALKGDVPSPTFLCPSPPTPNPSHGGAGTLVPPQLAQSSWVWGSHGAEHPSKAGGSSLGQLSPRVRTPVQKWHQCPGTHGLAKRCWESSATLARVLWITVGTSGLGDIKATLAAGTHDAQGASREPSWLSDPRGNIPNAVSHVRNNSWPTNHPWGPKMPPPLSRRNGGDAPDSLGCLDPLLVQLERHEGLWQLSQVGLEGSCGTQRTQGSAPQEAPRVALATRHRVVSLLGILTHIPPNLPTDASQSTR